MKVNDFITKYNKANDKDKFLEDCIVNQYIPYSEKVADCVAIINATTETDGVFKANTPAQFMLFMVQMISRYTEIEKEENILGLFEQLDEINLINAIVSKIPERELASYNTILDMVRDDYMENNRSLISFVETKVKALGLSLDAVLEVVQKYISENIPEAIEVKE